MTRHPHLDPGSFFLQGGPVAALLIHGFTGSPPEMRLIGDYLNERGLAVSGPLLPGHGTTVEDMNRSRWTDWVGRVEDALIHLQTRCETVFVGGLSMGSVLALHLAAHHPELPGAVLYSPAIIVSEQLLPLTPVLKWFVRSRPKSGQSSLTDPQADALIWSYEDDPVVAAHELLKLQRRVRGLLPRVTCPLLIVHSTRDPAIHPQSARYTYERVGSLDKELVTLSGSGHCLTVDAEWESVAEKTHQFIRAHS